MIPFRDLRIGDVIPRTTPRGLMSAHAQPPTWYALQVAAQKERATVATLTRADAFAFCPMQVRQRVKNGRTTEREFPVVGRIVYARFDRVPNWDILRDRRIITGVIAANGEPVILPAHVIRQLQGLPAATAANAARGLAALDAWAEANGKPKANAAFWEYEMDGFRFAIMADNTAWQSAKASRPDLVMYTMREVAIALKAVATAAPHLATLKAAAPAAVLSSITPTRKANDDFDDEIPY